MSNKGKLVVLSAPSGAGKTSICKELLKRNKNWLFSVSVTTREKRDNEVDGVDYIFISKEKFDLIFDYPDLSHFIYTGRYDANNDIFMNLFKIKSIS